MVQEVLQRQVPWRWGAQWPAIRSWQRTTERIIETDHLTTIWEIDHSIVIWRLKQIGKMKNLDKWCLMSWMQIKKAILLKCHFLFYATTTKPFLNRIVTCDEKWILHDNQQWPAQCLDWEGVPKHFSKSNLHSKKVMITVWWSAASLIHDSFLKTGKTITSEKCTQQMDEMHWKLPVLQGCSCRLH